ncbi:MAG: sugar phosphate isomerase/epimerase [Oscillospiraceae bacterium]|nr:sugar phosphate isomerase/epimerase [Oscillospiraceae bacterium]
MKITAQAYTIRDFCKTPEDIAVSFKKLADIGYRYVQASGMGAIEPIRLKEIADQTGLEVVITHTSPDRILEDTMGVINDHRIFGCNHIGIGSLPGKYQTGAEGYRQFTADFNPAAKILADNGMMFHYHNHHFEYEKDGGEVLFDILVNETNPKHWGFIIDTYWVQFAGRCPAKQIEALKDRVVVCHVKDMAIVNRGQKMAPVYEGNLNFDEILESCAKANVQYLAVEQDDCNGKDPFECLKISYDNLKKKLG